VFFVCCVDSGLCEGLITCLEEFYRVCLIVCNRGTTVTRTKLGCCDTKKGPRNVIHGLFSHDPKAVIFSLFHHIGCKTGGIKSCLKCKLRNSHVNSDVWLSTSTPCQRLRTGSTSEESCLRHILFSVVLRHLVAE
jgi:hypothetical protein